MGDETNPAKDVPAREIDPKLLAEVANRVEFEGVRLEQSAAKIVGTFNPSIPHVALTFLCRTAWRPQQLRPGFDVRFEFGATLLQRDETNEQQKVAEFALVYVLEYRLPEAPPEDWRERLEMFSGVNGVVNAWPFIRAELSALLSKMMLPQVLLPIYRPGRPLKGSLEFEMADSAPVKPEQK